MLLVFTTLLLPAFNSQAGKDDDTNTGAPFYPYRIKDKWGFCTAGKTIVIPCQYERVFFTQKYYIGISGRHYTLYDVHAKRIDSAAAVYLLPEGAVLLVNATKNQDETINPQQARFMELMAEIDVWDQIQPAKAKVLDRNYHSEALSDSVIALHKHFNDILWLRNGSKQGIYDATERKFVVPMQEATVHLTGDLFVVKRSDSDISFIDLQGIHKRLPPKAAGATDIQADVMQFTLREGNTNKVYDSTGRLLLQHVGANPVVTNVTGETRTLGYSMYKAAAETATSLQRNNRLQFLDRTGKLRLENIGEMESLYGTYYIVHHRDAMNRLDDSYIYNAATYKKVFDIFKNGRELNKDHLLFKERDTAGKNTRIYSYKGDRLMTLYDTVMYRGTYPEEIIGRFSAGYTNKYGSHYSKGYTAVRPGKQYPFIVYDDDFNVVSKDYDVIVDMHIGNTTALRVRRNGKWGVLDALDFHALIPVVYDSVQYSTQPYVHVWKEGKGFWVDTANKVLFGGKDFDYVDAHAVKGRWLAMQLAQQKQERGTSYKKPEALQVWIIDAEGRQLAAWKGSNDKGYDYKLTAAGTIIRYGRDDYYKRRLPAQVYDPATGKEQTLPYAVTNVELYDGVPVLITCINEEGERGMVSPAGLQTVVPFAPDVYYRTRNAMFLDGMKQGLLLSTINNSDKEEETGIGFYSIDGIAYWKD